MTLVGAPYFEDLTRGMVVSDAPAVTLTSGHAALHQAILGDRLRPALDASLTPGLLGVPGPLAHPALVCDIAIGQSTVITQRVVANLFYRGLVLRRPVEIGDTLRTETEVVALRQNTLRPGRRATGLAALRIRTTDQLGRRVLDFWRCAMLPLRDPEAQTGWADELDTIPSDLDWKAVREAAAPWRLDAFRARTPGPHFCDLETGMAWQVPGGDVVSCAPELARLTLNIAMAHHDAEAAGGRRLVYGGHTVGIAASQVTRVLPNLVTVIAWQSCDHLAPVYEGDLLTSDLEVEGTEALTAGGGLAHLRSRVTAVREEGETSALDWRFVALMA